MTTSSEHTDSCTKVHRNEWQAILADAVTDADELCRLLDLPPATAEEAHGGAGSFRLLVPRPYLDRIRPGDPTDPLLRQVLPVRAEMEGVEGFVEDPLGERNASCAPGLLSKYRGRSLIVATARCGVHCRFCFRRHGAASSGGSLVRLEETLGHVAQDRAIREVILSGGDPLTLDDAILGEVARRLAEMEHIRRLRLHTRMPVVIPQRVTDDLLKWLKGTRLTVLIVLHVNHPAEVDASVARSIERLADAGIPLLSQSVLLRGVNDRCDVQADLLERLVDLRVMPYYLHQLDRVAGAAHFEVPVEEGIELIRGLRNRLPGYAVPRYVRDIPGDQSKQVLI